MTDSSQTRLAHIAESAWGTTPATPTFLNIRYTGESFKPNIQNVSSNEIRPDRNVPDLVQVGSEAGGGFDFELSYGNLDTILESLMYSTWSTNVLKNGVTQKSLTIEKTFEAGSTDQYHRFPGAIANSLSLNVRAREIVTGNVSFVAKKMEVAQAIIASATYTAVPANPVMNAASHFASLAMTGVTSPAITAISLSISNNLRQQPVLGSVDSRGVSAGRFNVSGSLDAYFENAELIDLFVAGTATDLTFKLGGASALNYLFEIGTLKFNDADIIAGGNDQPVMARMPFTGLYDSSDAATLKITRDPS